LREELETCSKALEDATGQSLRWFRPPFGGRRPNVLRTARKLGMEPVMWSITGYDWNAESSQQIVEKVTKQFEARSRPQGEIVLLHDGGHLEFGTDRHFTIEATRALLERYGSTKKFVSVANLAGV
jgi:peptidoglycan/xylan/chitin deacetylase (PgdA/CDA1 family)